ncbi:hypothetical protein MAR_013580, partial [Mya arenaria]
MDHSQEEASLKKKLQGFLTEMLKLGTVKGFKHFAMYMRGREEMVLSVVNTPQALSSSLPSNPVSIQSDHRKMRSLMLSMRSQVILSTHGVKDVGLPPASPSEEESLPTRLVKLTGESREKDCPLKLKSTLKWKDNEVFVWDIIAELVKLCTYPAPRNPFEIDFNYFNLLPLQEKVLASASMHFAALESLVKEQGLPILKQQQQQQQQQRSQPSQELGRTRTSSYNYPQSVPAPQTYQTNAP